MPKITPLQQSFAAGEISPLMFSRVDTEGYQQGVEEMTNMFPDSRGPAISRSGAHHIQAIDGVADGRVFPFPVNDNFFYSGVFVDTKLIIASMVGHNPGTVHSTNPKFIQLDTGWTSATDGNVTSRVVFDEGFCQHEVDANPNRWTYITQQVTLPLAGDYRVNWAFSGDAPMTIKVGTAADDGTYYNVSHTIGDGSAVFTAPGTTVWITIRLDSDGITALTNNVTYFGVGDVVTAPVEFVTPYLEAELHGLQAIPAPGGSVFYIVHERHPVYKLTYDRVTDAFSWAEVTFTGKPPEWTGSSWPSCGDFFEGRLWLGGTVNEPQTFWGSQSGNPEDFTIGTQPDDALQFTLAKYGRIEWIVGFKNLLIGTQNGEHIVGSDAGIITPSDIQVQQQSAYGSAGIQPVQVGDQVFYVSPDRRKLRAIQYEWQADNWLSKDLTFTSEHITKSGIRHITWHQNPGNLFHCALENGTIATMTYDRSTNTYGWAKMEFQGKALDITTGPIQGTDYVNLLITYDGDINKVYFETQTTTDLLHYMDSWVDREPDTPGGLTVSGLDHLEGKLCQVQVDGATHPDRTVTGGSIELQFSGDVITVGLQYIPRLKTLPPDKGAPTGSAQAWAKRWNKIYASIYESAKPLINGERAPERSPKTPMNTPQPVMSEDVLKIDLGYDSNGQIVIEQDLPYSLTVTGLYGELGQEIL